MMSLLVTSAAAPSTPAVDISRLQLKQLARWIRDDLDILVAREGPDILRPDDVLMLHELFNTLRHSTTITALDLRATGIHKAVKDIAGIATRWPGRLCDDCDKIITIWESKFGRFEELRPFLYGRGGRLEGIANVNELSREALLKRWAEYCPKKIHHNVSHRLGSLGFKAGDWWINPLFAHHAGIIGLESVEGGITHDKNGAYALVLKDSTEVNTLSEEVFSYRCPTSDKGKFRLTAATPTSREPIRVLRSHTSDSIWGPKAGTRYEGLYSVKGWCVRQAKLEDTIGAEWKEGDILYEITLHRKDSVPMEEVTRRPTNMEVDDYAEYKRLRKIQRENKRKDSAHLAMPQQDLGAVPPTSSLQPSASPTRAPHSLLRISPSVSRRTTLKERVFSALSESQEADRPLSTGLVSPKTIADLEQSFFPIEDHSTLATPVSKTKSKASSASSSVKNARVQSPVPGSALNSSRAVHGDLKEIIPWIDEEFDLSVPPSLIAPSKVKEQIESPAAERRPEAKAAELNPVKNFRRLARDPRLSISPNRDVQSTMDSGTARSALNLRLPSIKPSLPMMSILRPKLTDKERDSKRLSFGKKTRFLDGTGYSADEEGDCYDPVPTRRRRFRSNSVDDLPLHYAPIRIEPVRPSSLFDYGIEDIEFSSPLDELAPRAEAASRIDSAMTTCPEVSRVDGERVALGKLRRWLSK